MAQFNDPRQLFAFKLSKVHTAEKEILEVLRTMQEEASDPEIKSGLERHTTETEQQITNLEQAFSALGEKPQDTKARVVEALRTDHNEFKREASSSTPPEIIDAFLLGAAAHTEHHEISAYESLITMAEAMGEQDIVATLRENLEQEQNMLMQVQQAEQKLATQLAQQIPV